MVQTPRDQPSDVSTKDTPRPPDKSVVTTDSPVETAPSDPGAAAAPPGEPGASNDQAPAAGGKAKPQRDRPLERKLNRLAKQLGEAERSGKADKATITELQTELTELKANKAAAEAPAEPKLSDHPNPRAYAKAYSKWEKDVETASKPAPKAPAKPRPDTPAKPPESTAVDPAIKAWQKTGVEMYGDEFQEALEAEGTAVNQVMGEFLEDSEHGHAIYIHLRNNQEDSRKIFNSGPARVDKAMKALETKAKAGELDIEGELKVAKAPDPGPSDRDPKKTPAAPGGTKAPTPPSSTKDGAQVNLTADPENESMDEYAARRTKETLARDGRIVN